MKMLLRKPWTDLNLKSALHDKGLWLEIFTDLGSILGLLILVRLAGDSLITGGWLSVWVWLVAGKDAHLVYVVGNVLVLLLVYWVPCILYIFLDLFRPELFYKYKVQREKAQREVNLKVLGKVVSLVLMNQVVQGIIGGEVAWRWRYQYINMDTSLMEVPSFKM